MQTMNIMGISVAITSTQQIVSNSGSTAKQIGTVQQRETTTTTHQKTALPATVASTQMTLK